MKFFWLIGGNLAYAFSQWLILVILARFFTPEDLGGYFFCLALITPIALFFSVKLSNLIVTLENEKTNYKDIFGFRLILNFLLCLTIYILYFIFFQSKVGLLVLTSVLVYKITEQYDDLIIAYDQRNLNFKNIFLIKFLRSLVYVLAILVSIYVVDEFEEALLLATVIYSFYWIIRNYEKITNINLNTSFYSLYLKNGLYLSISSSLSSLSVSGVRLYIGYVLGVALLAVYGVISYSLIAFSIIVSALGQYFLPVFVKIKNDKKNFLKKILESQLVVLLICLSFIVVSYFFGDDLLVAFYGDQYKNYGYFLCLVFVANLFKSSSALIGTAMTALKIYNFQLKITIISLILTVFLTPFLVMEFNILGAFLALLLVNIVEWLLYIFCFRREAKGGLL